MLYSAKPGRVVETLPHPFYENYESSSIGPLARRLLMVFEAAFKSEQGLSVGRFLAQMNDPAFDPMSVVADHTVLIRGETPIDNITSSSPASYGVDQRLGGALVRVGPRTESSKITDLPRLGSSGVDGR